MRLRTTLLFLLSGLGFFPLGMKAQAPDTLVVDSLRTQWELSRYLQVGPDQSGERSWEDWVKRPRAFAMRDLAERDGPLSVEHPWWLHLRLRSALPIATEWVFYLPPLGEAEAFVITSDSAELVAQYRSGRYVRAEDKPENKGPDVHIPLTLEPGQTYDLLLRLRSVDQEPIPLEAQLYARAHWNQLELEPRRPLILFFQGIFWVMLVYNLVLFFNIRFEGYLYYALYLLSLSLFVSVAVGELTHPEWGDPRWWRPLGFLAFGVINVCYFQFGRVLLSLKTILPRWDRFLRYYIWLKLAVLAVVQLEIAIWYNIALSLNVEFAFFFFEVALSLALFASLLRQGTRLAYYFVAGSGSVIVIGLSSANLGHLMGYQFTFIIFLCTVGVEIIFFSLSLAYRIRKNERERLKVQKALNEELSQVNTAFGRFVPHEFLRSLGRHSVLDIQLGDSVEKEVTVLFSDIRGYTALSEQMTPEENFRFLNAYLGRMGPVIQTHRGFVNQYYGDGIMALFMHSADDALKAALSMMAALNQYNRERVQQGRMPIETGIGLHTGPLMMGVIGDTLRLEAGVVSDTVNTAARMEGLTKYYRAELILSQEVMMRLQIPERQSSRFLGQVQVKGRRESVGIYECYAADPPPLQAAKVRILEDFEQALAHYFAQEFSQAIRRLDAVLEHFPQDAAAQRYRRYALQHLTEGVPEGWTGVELMHEK